MSSSLLRRIKSHRLYPEVSKFAVVGGLGYSSDVIVFNILRSTTSLEPLLAKALSLTVSTLVAFVGNRQWTYRERAVDVRPAKIPMQGLIFIAVNVMGMLIQMGFLWFSHYVLGFTSLLADNISGNILGMAVATAFRFWGYRTWVFRHTPPTAAEAEPDGESAIREVGAVHNASVSAGEGDPMWERSTYRPQDHAGTDR
ncbi:MAG TPA: GtrA family protein [Yinghuangia sp.]|uniref:GtrA family protein n=1 Tax=Yinghuangia sp. YIM S10712 TaxID=3436930 RepID=UPI002BAC58F1|nr:GtrA family protein [Yinghuangia sp.]